MDFHVSYLFNVIQNLTRRLVIGVWIFLGSRDKLACLFSFFLFSLLVRLVMLGEFPKSVRSYVKISTQLGVGVHTGGRDDETCPFFGVGILGWRGPCIYHIQPKQKVWALWPKWVASPIPSLGKSRNLTIWDLLEACVFHNWIWTTCLFHYHLMPNLVESLWNK